MNLVLQDIVEPKVLGDSLHLHPVAIVAGIEGRLW